MTTKNVFGDSKTTSKKASDKRKAVAKKSEPEPLTYGALVVLHIDKGKKRVYIGVDPEKSTSRFEELQSEDAKSLAVSAARKAGMSDVSILNQPSIAYFSTTENKPVSAAVADQPGVVLCTEVEVVAFGGGDEFVGDSVDVLDKLQ